MNHRWTSEERRAVRSWVERERFPSGSFCVGLLSRALGLPRGAVKSAIVKEMALQRDAREG